jgi:tRNA 2-thiouridine synthesizing protein A
VTVFAVEARGLKCPLPVLLARRALRQHGEIELITTDPASVLDVPVFCAEAGHALAHQAQAGEVFTFRIVARAPA